MNFHKISPDDLVNTFKTENSLLKRENERLKNALNSIIDKNTDLLAENKALHNILGFKPVKGLYYLSFTTSTLGSFKLEKN